MSAMLEVRNVSKHFGSLVAVQDVSLTVAKGELRAIIGPNGAGKTTFFNMISGFFPPTKGDIVFDGEVVTKQTVAARVASGMARTFQITEIFPELSVRENVRIAQESADGYRLHMWVSRAETARVMREVDELMTVTGLDGKADRLVGELSHGDQRAAEIAMALALRPRLLLLDEPTAGHGRTGDLSCRRADPSAAQGQQLYDCIDRARHAGGVQPGGSHHGAGRGQDAGRWHAAGDRRGSARAGGVSGEGRMNALEAEGLNTFYGKSHILHDVGLTVAEGRITTLLGRNGAGKSTTLRSLVGLTPPRSGHVRVFGQETTRLPTYRIAALGVGYVPEGRRIFANLTVDENLQVPLERPGPFTIPRIYQLFPRLAERKQNRGRQLSGGEQEMLSIARALLLNPRLLILDEPSQGLAPLIVREVFRIVAQMRTEGISVLLVEQNVRVALEVADDAYVIENGQIVYTGLAAELGADEERIQALAGASAEEWHLDEMLPT